MKTISYFQIWSKKDFYPSLLVIILNLLAYGRDTLWKELLTSRNSRKISDHINQISFFVFILFNFISQEELFNKPR